MATAIIIRMKRIINPKAITKRVRPAKFIRLPKMFLITIAAGTSAKHVTYTKMPEARLVTYENIVEVVG